MEEKQMKKTLAIVLALVMVLSVMAMIPASAANKVVLGWEEFSHSTLTAEGTNKVKMTAKGNYVNTTGSAGIMISAEPVDISQGFEFTIYSATGLTGKDTWLSVFFIDKKTVFDAAASKNVNSGAGFLWRGDTTQRLDTHTLGPSTAEKSVGAFETWGAGRKTNAILTASGAVWGNGANEVKVSLVNSGSLRYIALTNNGQTVMSLAEASINDTRKAAVSQCLNALGNECYVLVGLSQINADGSNIDTSVTVSALKTETTPTNPTTGDSTMIFALVALISLGVVVGSTVVLKKRED